ncbi:MAG: TIGR03013 family PEP-CTERM/XrtA system glycosyltransferase [Nitrospirae bacterium]|nr:MAG: TIGR03013 family PEP-CTERM/XrtA system glycosyltransferase [Nitrospirota bacterium]
MIESGLHHTPVVRRREGVVAKAFPFTGLRKKVLILGDGRLANNLARVLLGQRRNRYDILGFVTCDASNLGKQIVNPKVIGTLDRLFDLAERERVDIVAVCFDEKRGTMPVETLLDLKSLGVQVVDGYRLYEEECGRLPIDELRPSFLVFSSGFRRRPVAMAMKRAVDLVGSSCGLVLLAPLLMIIALLIKLDSPGPVLYRQTRVGMHGRPYTLLKFRSMRHDAEAEGVKWAAERDPRVTKVGYWLRKLRLDELPQFLNVLKGEMSLVGPRPERPQFVHELREIIPYYDLRHTVRPGITGWAQTCFQYAASIDDSHMKLQYDLYYVKNLSLSLDLKILLKTVKVVLLGVGAR